MVGLKHLGGRLFRGEIKPLRSPEGNLEKAQAAIAAKRIFG